MLSKSGVYQLSCNNCTGIYIGQSGRNFKLRVNEHQKAYKNGSTQSHFAKHLLEYNHSLDFKPKILHIAKKGSRLNVLEKMEIIQKNSNPGYILTNEYIFRSSSPLLTATLQCPSPSPTLCPPVFLRTSVHHTFPPPRQTPFLFSLLTVWRLQHLVT